MMRASLVCLLALGCGEPPAPSAEPSAAASISPGPVSSASAPPLASADGLEPAPPLPVELPLTRASPLAASATPDQRREAVLSLLAGGEPATRLPIRATEKGKGFDHALRDKVAPLSASMRRPPSVRMGATNVSAGLPPEVVQRIVRRSFGRFRLCYENGLKVTPTLAGRVDIRFKISKTGTVDSATATSAEMAPAVVSCVEKAFLGLSFPEPEGGKIVDVRYPITFAPGGS
jgi:hypothetical protein